MLRVLQQHCAVTLAYLEALLRMSRAAARALYVVASCCCLTVLGLQMGQQAVRLALGAGG